MQLKRRTNIVWGLVLLAVSAVILLHALDIIPDGVYDLALRGWPVLLVFVGLSVLLRGRLAFGGVAALLVSAVLLGVVGVVAFNTRALQQRDDYRQPVNQAVAENVSLLRIQVDMLTTNVELLPGLNRAVTGQFSGSVESAVSVSYQEEGASAVLSVVETRANPFPLLENIGRGTLRLELPPGVPLDVEVRVVSGDALLNTSNLNLERLNLDSREGDALITLPAYQPLGTPPGSSLGTLAARSGDLTILIPGEVGARLELNRGSAQPEYDPAVYNFLVGDILEARNIETAGIRLLYNLTVPQGRIRVQVP